MPPNKLVLKIFWWYKRWNFWNAPIDLLKNPDIVLVIFWENLKFCGPITTKIKNSKKVMLIGPPNVYWVYLINYWVLLQSSFWTVLYAKKRAMDFLPTPRLLNCTALLYSTILSTIWVTNVNNIFPWGRQLLVERIRLHPNIPTVVSLIQYMEQYSTFLPWIWNRGMKWRIRMVNGTCLMCAERFLDRVRKKYGFF